MKHTMSTRELGRLALVKGAIDGKYTVQEVAAKLHLSMRRVKQIKRAVRERGDGAVIHATSGRHPSNRTPESLRQKIISLKRSEFYKDTNFTRFKELLAERENISVGYTTLSTILKAAGIVPEKTHGTSGEKRSHRPRRDLSGELSQTDASPFDWFGIGKQFSLHGFQDDATGDILGLYMTENECLQGYLEAFRPVLINFGVPAALYADRIGVCFVNNKKTENRTIEEQLAGKTPDKTQFGMIADELGVELIPAGSPQAKGRVERLWQTGQDRLTVFFAMNGVKDIGSANAVLPRFIPESNSKFGRQAKTTERTAFAPLPEKYGLGTLLCAKYERTTDNCSSFPFQNYTFQIESPKPLARKKIVFVISEKQGFRACYDKVYYPVKFIGFTGKKQDSYLPEVTKRLLFNCYFASVKNTAKAGSG
jgi:transposase